MELFSTMILAQNDFGGGGGEGPGAIAIIIYLILLVIIIAGMWKAFSKAGQPGWAAIIPIYNVVVWCQIAGRPVWWVLLLLIPCVNIVIPLILSLDTAKSFGKGAGFGIGLWLLGFIFWPILGFGDAQYVGAAAAAGTGAGAE